jgi:hypothetical protein
MGSSINRRGASGRRQDSRAIRLRGIHKRECGADLAAVGRGEVTTPKRLTIGLRYRVDGILHEYLGPAQLPDSEIAHVFLRNEWRPDTPGQLPLTLVAESQVDRSVVQTRTGGSDANRHRWMRSGWE